MLDPLAQPSYRLRVFRQIRQTIVQTVASIRLRCIRVKLVHQLIDDLPAASLPALLTRFRLKRSDALVGVVKTLFYR